jgi:hypothetical protein
MTPAAALENQAQLWVFCYSGLCNHPGDHDRHPANGTYARSTTTELSLLSKRETLLGVVHGCHPSFGTPRWF